MGSGQVLGWDDETYFADTTRVSRSMLDVFRKHPRLYHERFVAKTAKAKAPSKAMALGTIVHSLVLEDAKEFAVAPKVDKRTNKGKEQLAEFEAENAGKTIVDADTWKSARKCRDSLVAHPMARHILTMPGEREVAIGWECEATALASKAKLDQLVDGIVPDLKTTKDPSPDAFCRSVIDLGYHRQAAMYIEAAGSLGNQAKFVFICVRNCAPYDVALYELGVDELALGEKQIRQARADLLVAMTGDDWRAPHERKLIELHMPAWAMRELEESA